MDVPENSDCISLELKSSKCSGCRCFEEDRKLKPKKKRTSKQACAKQWKKENLSHRHHERVARCKESRMELQKLGYGSVGNLCNEPDPSYGTPSLTRQRATKRFVDVLTPRVSSF